MTTNTTVSLPMINVTERNYSNGEEVFVLGPIEFREETLKFCFEPLFPPSLLFCTLQAILMLSKQDEGTLFHLLEQNDIDVNDEHRWGKLHLAIQAEKIQQYYDALSQGNIPLVTEAAIEYLKTHDEPKIMDVITFFIANPPKLQPFKKEVDVMDLEAIYGNDKPNPTLH